MKNKRYGVPYMGSKNAIARLIVDRLPTGEVLVEPFAGGCSIAHAAMEANKYKRYILNDIGDAPMLFKDAIEGKYKDECRWITREDFKRLKDSDPYVRYCWSFGNRGGQYLYGRDIEELRRLQWELCFAKSPIERHIAYRHVIDELYKMGLLLCYPDYSKGQKDSPRLKARLESMKLESLDRLKAMQSLQALNRFLDFTTLQELQRLQGLEAVFSKSSASKMASDKAIAKSIANGFTVDEHFEVARRVLSLFKKARLTIVKGDYRELTIPEEAIVYCDPPYSGCATYNEQAFNSKAFHEWALSVKNPIYISEYSMPEGFTKIWERRKIVRLCAKDNRDYAVECLYRPSWQVEREARELEASLKHYELVQEAV